MLEECALKRKAASAAKAALPFVPLSIPVKPRSELQAIQAKNKQLGVVSTTSAHAAAMQRSNSAPQLPSIRAVPVAPNLGRGSSSRCAAVGEPLHVASNIRLHNTHANQILPESLQIVRSSRVKSKPSRFKDGSI